MSIDDILSFDKLVSQIEEKNLRECLLELYKTFDSTEDETQIKRKLRKTIKNFLNETNE